MMSIESSFDVERRPFFAGVLDRLRSNMGRRNEIQRLDTREMVAIAHELNLSRAELTSLNAS
jgi:hypothetical protein